MLAKVHVGTPREHNSRGGTFVGRELRIDGKAVACAFEESVADVRLDPRRVLSLAVGIALIFAGAWTWLPNDARQPVMVYVGSYLLTYCIGGVWIGLSDGQALASYFKDQSIYIPSVPMLGAEYWYLLLAPLVVPCLCGGSVTQRRKERTVQAAFDRPAPGSSSWYSPPSLDTRSFAFLAPATASSRRYPTLANLQGDTATLVERRIELFDTGTTAAFGIVYSALPALSHLALFKATNTGKSWHVMALLAIIATFGLSTATFQIAPAAVFLVTLSVSATHLGCVRMTWVKVAACGIAFLLLLQVLNAWKFGKWTLGENLQHIVFRMPAAYPYLPRQLPRHGPVPGHRLARSVDWPGNRPWRAVCGVPSDVSRVDYRRRNGGARSRSGVCRGRCPQLHGVHRNGGGSYRRCRPATSTVEKRRGLACRLYPGPRDVVLLNPGIFSRDRLAQLRTPVVAPATAALGDNVPAPGGYTRQAPGATCAISWSLARVRGSTKVAPLLLRGEDEAYRDRRRCSRRGRRGLEEALSFSASRGPVFVSDRPQVTENSINCGVQSTKFTSKLLDGSVLAISAGLESPTVERTLVLQTSPVSPRSQLASCASNSQKP